MGIQSRDKTPGLVGGKGTSSTPETRAAAARAAASKGPYAPPTSPYYDPTAPDDGPAAGGNEIVGIEFPNGNPFGGPSAEEMNQGLKDTRYARRRSGEISKLMETTQGDEGEYQNLLSGETEKIDSVWHDAGQNVAESYARRGLGGSGMDTSDQYGLAQKRYSAVQDAEMKARAAAIAKERYDLAQEQQSLIGMQGSDINAQRLAMEDTALKDQVLSDAIAALAEAGMTYSSEAQKKKDAAAAAERKAGV